MEDLRLLAETLQPKLKPSRGRAPEVPYIMAAILLAREPQIGGREACRRIDGADESAGHGRVTKLAVRVRAVLACNIGAATPCDQHATRVSADEGAQRVQCLSAHESACGNDDGDESAQCAPGADDPADRVSIRLDARSTDTSVLPAANSELASLRAVATACGTALHDVPGDNSCQFHALLHTLNTQLNPGRALDYDVKSLRAALVATLEDSELLGCVWLAEGDCDATSVTYLRDEVRAQAARSGYTLDQWFTRMRRDSEWGDGATLIVAALLFNVRIHVLTVLTSSGVYTVEVPDSFGPDFVATDEIMIAVYPIDGRVHPYQRGRS